MKFVKDIICIYVLAYVFFLPSFKADLYSEIDIKFVLLLCFVCRLSVLFGKNVTFESTLKFQWNFDFFKVLILNWPTGDGS